MHKGRVVFGAMEEVVFGRPASEAVVEQMDRLGAKRAFLMVSGTLNRETDEIEKIRRALGARYAATFDAMPAHTPRSAVIAAADQARAANADLIVTVGGGSITDGAKAVQLCLANDIRTVEGIDRIRAVKGAPPPMNAPVVRQISAPTTIAGGDFSSSAGVTNETTKVKEAVRHPLAIPRAVILDPRLGSHTPEWLWLSTGIRAVDHCVEGICSDQSHPYADAQTVKGLSLLTQALPRVKADAGDLDARMDCQIGTWLSMGGLSSGVPMGASHGIGYVLGAEFGVPHGYTSCVMLPFVMRWNKSVNAARQALVSAAMGHPGEDAGDVLDAFIRGLGMPRSLREVKVGPESFDRIAQQAMATPWVPRNPRKIEGPAQVREILDLAHKRILDSMYTGKHAHLRPLQPAFIMASTGEAVTYRELDARNNRLAHLLRNRGMKRLDHYSIFMENNNRYLEACGAGERSGLYFTCVNSYLTSSELAYILTNSQSRILITSKAKLDIAREALKECPKVELCIVADGEGESERIVGLQQATAGLPATPVADESVGTAMLYSSGTTGRPKGILRPLPEQPPVQNLPIFDFLLKLWHYREGMVYLSPAPLYHSAPQAAVNLTIRSGGTVVIMESFDPERYLALVEQWGITHTQLVPTMFSRMLKLPAEVRKRYDLSTLEIAIHAAAPCPAAVKDEMIKWWGPIIHEYYGATEGLGFTACDSEQWLAHRGSVGKVLLGDLHILDETLQPSPKGTPGTVWFKTATPFEYFGDPAKTAESRSPDGSMSTVGDVGYVDDDGYLYLTDRATFMIISGGVNIYPQECENLLITHPKIADAAVFGVPNPDLGEEVKAVVQPMPGVAPGQELADELIAFCSQSLSRQKVPRSIDFEAELPRLPTGKLYKRLLRDRYWGNKTSRIV